MRSRHGFFVANLDRHLEKRMLQLISAGAKFYLRWLLNTRVWNFKKICLRLVFEKKRSGAKRLLEHPIPFLMKMGDVETAEQDQCKRFQYKIV
jgi:hypothetical protein